MRVVSGVAALRRLLGLGARAFASAPTRALLAGAACALAAGTSGCDVATGMAQRAGVLPTFEEHCAKALPPTRVEVRVVSAAHAVDESRPYVELARMGIEAGANERVIGLTRARIGHSASMTIAGIEDPRSRRVCVRPDIRVDFSLQPMTVFVGREFSGDECRRAAILEHEMKHVTVYRDYVAELAREVEQEITQAYGDTVLQFASREEAQREIEQALSGYLDPLLGRASREVQRRQEGIDTPAEYARVAAACGGIALEE
jgi:hypothetical protein